MEKKKKIIYNKCISKNEEKSVVKTWIIEVKNF